MDKKICVRCKKEKDISEFRANKRNKDGLNGACRNCCTEYARIHRADNKEMYRSHYKKYNKSEKAQRKHRKFRKTDKFKKIQERFRNKPENKQKIHEYTTTPEYRAKVQQRRRDNIEVYHAKEREYNRKRRLVPEVRIKCALRARLCTILKRSNGSKSGKMVELIGCTMPFLRQYLESLWRDNMSWQNYGFGRGKWVIDHIIACEKFDLTDPTQQKQCFNFKNLQPLWWEENAAKSDN